MEIGTAPNGEVVFSAVLTGERWRREKAFKMSKWLRARFDEPLDVVNKLRNWKRGSAWVKFNFTNETFTYVYAEFYNEEARLVKIRQGKCFSVKNDISFDNAKGKLVKAGKDLMNSKASMFFNAENIEFMGAFRCLAWDAYFIFTQYCCRKAGNK